MEENRYEILNKTEDIFINDIPLEVNQISIKKDLYTDKKIIDITIKNIGLKKINSIKLFIKFLNNKGLEKDRIEFIYDDIELKSNLEKKLQVNIEFKDISINDVFNIIVSEIEVENEHVIQKEILLNRVKSENSISKLGKLGNQYKREIRSITNKTINVKSQYKKISKLWQCACGNYNFEDISVCPNCKLKRKELERISEKEYLEEKLKEYEKKQAELKDKTIKKAKKAGSRTLKIIIIVAVAIIIGVTTFFIGKDVIVKKMLKENNVGQAIRLNNNVIKDYKNYIYKLIEKYEINNDIDNEMLLLSNITEYALDNEYLEKFIETQYKYITKEYENQNYENCYTYLDNLLQNEKYKNNSELLEKAIVIKYYKAIDYIEKEEYEIAKQMLENIEYADSKSKLDITNYNIAKRLLKNKQYKEAKELFEKMNNPYEDSNELLNEAKYNYIIEKYEKYKTSDNYELYTLEQIRDELSSLTGYKDTNNYLAEVNDALIWHGVWHNVAFGEEYYYHYDIKFNYFTKTLTSNGINGIKNKIKYEKDGDRFISNGYTITFMLYKKGENLIRTNTNFNGVFDSELQYKR